MIYKTTESNEAILFKTFSYPYIGAKKIVRPSGKTVVEFEFDVPTLSHIQNITKDYYNHVLSVDAYDHDEASKFIRKEIYDHTH
jgi:hypothetical protein